jgi:hypothetical protein
VPGKNPAEAIREYIEPLQRSLSCLTKSVLRPSAYEPDIISTVTFFDPSSELSTRADESLHLSFIQTLFGHQILAHVWKLQSHHTILFICTGR